MFAIIYLTLVFLVGDRLASRHLPFVSLPHKLAVSFLTGIIGATWFTYLAAFAFSKTSNPMLWGNVLFFLCAIGFLVFHKTPIPSISEIRESLRAAQQEEKWDLIFIGIFVVVATWLMFSTFSYADGGVLIANHQWSDFGSTVSIMQSFAEGHNFPTEYPHFPGDRIRYHFLFYFQAGNLEYLGMNPALSNNVLSILSLVSMLVLVMTLGRVLFNSRVVGRVGALFFFFHGSLAFIPFLISTGSFTKLFNKLPQMRDFLPSGFPYRGEDWGVWSQVVFANQRHLASSIGILLIVLIYLTIQYKRQFDVDTSTDLPSSDNGFDQPSPVDKEPLNWLAQYSPFVFLGALMGLLPLWNGAVFAAAGTILGSAFLLFPYFRREMIALAVSTAVVALPQIFFLKSGLGRPVGYSLFHWGYTLDDPTPFNVIYYLLFTFGFKWLLIGVAIYLSSGFQRRILIAVSGLIALTFCFQFSEEVLANHKFLNVWLVITNVFAGYGLVSLWNLGISKWKIVARVVAVVATSAIFIGGALDFYPIKNSYWVEMKYEGDPLVDWIKTNTRPESIFLSKRYVNHRILLAGRKLFYGHPYYAWGAGHDTGTRDAVYKKLFESNDATEVHRLLKENRISHVAIDNGMRKDEFINDINESIYEAYFPMVFSDTENLYDGLKIYIVTDTIEAQPIKDKPAPDGKTEAVQKPAVNPFMGGEGNAPGQFSKPRGIAADQKGNLYVADTGNSRIQKFDAEGKSLFLFGEQGEEEGQLKEPNGIAIDEKGDIYVTDALRARLIKFGPDGKFLKEWKGPETHFYGPRDIAFGPNKQLYIVDQGRTRIVRFDPASEGFTEWGSAGSGEGQFTEATGLAFGADLVFVADNGNNRIQVFDLDGKFVRQWEVPAWERYPWHYPDPVFDDVTKRLYVTSGVTNEILAFDVGSNSLQGIKPDEDGKLDNPGSLVILETKKKRQLAVLNTGGHKISLFDIESRRDN